MIRTVLYLLIAIFLITFLRYVIGIIGKVLSDLFLSPGAGRSGAKPASSRPQAAGELKRDPVCGTFVAEAASIKKTVNGREIHFCSAACRDKYVAG